MPRSLIVARIAPGAEDAVARVFADSDRTDLPAIAGVTHRSLWALGDLYVHLLETRDAGRDAIERARAHPEFARVSERLAAFITPYLPTWREPKDAQAHCFYAFEPDIARPTAAPRRQGP